MAQSPAHKFGQTIGNLLEDVMKPVFQEFCEPRNLYLDAKGQRAGVRKGSKVTWMDRYGNSHDLDFVIEKDGADDRKGRPIAFVEVAWRRYTKHSRNKAQEIQAAILPIAEEWQWDRPFVGVVLAGFFTGKSIEQLQSFGFSVLYFKYESIVLAFEKAGIDIRFDESTTDNEFSSCIQKIQSISDAQYARIKKNLLKFNQDGVESFMNELACSLDRVVERLIVIPLHGAEYVFLTCADALGFIRDFDQASKSGDFRKYEIMVKLSNGDTLDASFKNKEEIEKFLKYLSS